MSWKAKENILHFHRGDVVEEIQDNWKPYFEEVKSAKAVEAVKEEVKVEKKSVKKNLFGKK